MATANARLVPPTSTVSWLASQRAWKPGSCAHVTSHAKVVDKAVEAKTRETKKKQEYSWTTISIAMGLWVKSSLYECVQWSWWWCVSYCLLVVLGLTINVPDVPSLTGEASTVAKFYLPISFQSMNANRHDTTWEMDIPGGHGPLNNAAGPAGTAVQMIRQLASHSAINAIKDEYVAVLGPVCYCIHIFYYAWTTNCHTVVGGVKEYEEKGKA